MPEVTEDPIRVLVLIEDHPDMRTLVRLVLERQHGFEVAAEATSAEEALDALEEMAADDRTGVIVLDNSIEGPMTGLELATLLRELAPHAPIVLFTAHDLDAEVARHPAIDRFVRKDRITDLPAAVRELARTGPASRIVDLTVEERLGAERIRSS
jgi:DNA-binding NarL/FixJ family response regulator